VTNTSLAQSYLIKAEKRLKILPVLAGESAHSDVVREAQEIVELALKGMLRQVGIEPPKWHDVGELLIEYRARFPDAIQAQLQRLAGISAWLRKEREFSFYGDIDFIPTEHYSEADATRAMQDAQFTVFVAASVIPRPSDH
jgi:HEPN domain-containing protein